MATTLTDRFSGLVTAASTSRITGTPTGSLTDRWSTFLLLSGDMSDGDDLLLLSGDMTDGDDLLRLSGDGNAPSGTTATDRL